MNYPKVGQKLHRCWKLRKWKDSLQPDEFEYSILGPTVNPASYTLKKDLDTKDLNDSLLGKLLDLGKNRVYTVDTMCTHICYIPSITYNRHPHHHRHKIFNIQFNKVSAQPNTSTKSAKIPKCFIGCCWCTANSSSPVIRFSPSRRRHERFIYTCIYIYM